MAEFFEKFDLDLLDFEEPVVLAAQEVIDLFVQVPDLELGLEIDLVIVFAAQSIPRFATVLAHHDDRRLQGGERGEDQVHQDVGVGIKCPARQDEAVDHHPEEKDHAEENDERPTAAERRDRVGELLAEGQFLLELFADVARENFVLLQALDDFVVQRGEFADFVLQDFLHVIAAEFSQVVQTDEPFAVPLRRFPADELGEGRPHHFPDRAIAERLGLPANHTLRRLRLAHAEVIPESEAAVDSAES